MNQGTFARPILFLILAVLSIWLFMENGDLIGLVEKHHDEFRALQTSLKERRKNWAENSALEKTNRAGLDQLASQAIFPNSLPDFIQDLDLRMAAHSLFREDVAYAKRESAGSFSLVRIQMRLSGTYDGFRRFLADLEKHPRFLWVKSVQATQEKTFLKFLLVLQVLVRAE